MELTGKYNSTDDWPAHLSVGAVLVNDKQQIAFHHFAETKLGEIYLLMRETLNDNETLEAGIARGLQEEWGAQGRIVAFLDSMRCTLRDTLMANGRLMHKTTLYFLVGLQNIDLSKRSPDDPESSSDVVWLSYDEAISLLESQAVRLPERGDLHEAALIKTAKRFLDSRVLQNNS